MAPSEDAYGEAIRASHAGEESFEIVERDDGYIGPPGDPELYFSTSDEWTPRERAAMDRAEGRVLDVGCGAARAVPSGTGSRGRRYRHVAGSG